MNFAKKSISIVLAGVMAASSLFVGITASAATPQYTPIAASAVQAFKANPVVAKIDEDGWASLDCSNYFSFTPATTGTYIIKADTDAMYKSYDNADNPVYSPTYTDGAYRVDTGASVSVYEDADMSKPVTSTSVSPQLTATNYSYVNNSVVADEASKVYTSGIDFVELIAGKTYYIDADAAYAAYASHTWDSATNKYTVKEIKSDYLGSGSFSIMLSDWEADISINTKYVKIAVPTSCYEDGFVERKVYDSTIAEDAVYKGAGKDIVVPDNIFGASVVSVSGTENKGITSLTLSNTVKRVSGFDNLKSLAAVNLASVKTIGDSAFLNDTALTAVAIPATVESVGEGAFYNDTALANVSIANGVKEIGSYAFYNTALKGIVIPASVTEIGSYAFGYVSNLDANTVAPYDTTEVLAGNFAIGAFANDAAYVYAAQNGIAYYDVTAGCPHPYNTTTVAATLFNKGSKTSVCPLCGTVVKKSLKKKTFKIKSLTAKKASFVVKAAAKGITGYQVQYSTSKKFTKKTTKTVSVKTTKSLRKTVKGLKKGKRYYVRVRAIGVNAAGKKAYSKYTAVKSVKVK